MAMWVSDSCRFVAANPDRLGTAVANRPIRLAVLKTCGIQDMLCWICVGHSRETEFAMPSLSPPRFGSASSTDLLPWVDPYITQLFAEAELVELATSHQGADAPRSLLAGRARLASDDGDVRPAARAAAARRRRTESAQRLAHC